MTRKIATLGTQAKWHLPFHLIILNTHTKEKTEHFQAIAKERGWPIRIVQINRVVAAVHAAEEDTGSALGNIGQKDASAKDVFKLCQTDPQYRTAIKTICKQEGIKFDVKKTLFVSEDSHLKVEKKVWDIARKKLEPFVDTKVLNRADDNRKKSGPDAEVGPIAAAIGWEKLANIFRESAIEAGFDRLDFLDEAAFGYRYLSDPSEAPKKTINAKVKLTLATSDITKPIKLPENQIHATRMYLAEYNDPTTPNAKKWKHFLTHSSVRSKLLGKLRDKLKTSKKVHSFPRTLLKNTNTYDKKWNILHVRDFKWLPNKKGATLRERLYNLYTPTPSLEKADALVFPPLSQITSNKERNFAAYTLFKSIVAKSLEAREAYKPIIVQDDGSWTQYLNLITYLSNTGFFGNHTRAGFYETAPIRTCEGVTHISTGYFDVLHTKDSNARRRSTSTLLNHRMQGFTPFVSQSNAIPNRKTGVILAPQDSTTVAAFITASNGNFINQKMAIPYSIYLAKNNDNLIWGGGDSPGKGMEAVSRPYSEVGGRSCSGRSTPTILTTESQKGIPDYCTDWEINPDIYDRASGMIADADIIAAFPGGTGTVEEVMEVLLANGYENADKSIIFASPDIHLNDTTFWEPILPILYGKDVSHDIISNNGYAKHGVHFATDLNQLKKSTDQERSKVKQKRLRKSSRPIYTSQAPKELVA